MKHFRFITLLIILGITGLSVEAQETTTFPSSDGIPITADTYFQYPHETTPLIVLFHQAGWSRGEYLEIAPQLNELGFNCLAVDLRSGYSINQIANETAKQASQAGKSMAYLDALVDVEAALRYARETYHLTKLIAWGSSYSASLVLKVAGDTPGLVDGVLAFSPGEYFEQIGKPETKTFIQAAAPNITCPVFITSGKYERNDWIGIYETIGSAEKVFYLPETYGKHGSSALWSQTKDHAGYWEAVTGFLEKYFKLAALK